ncbi:hypothetical protein D7X94_09410 [Acutalibacter sp. 1XD8-33]|nr:hypothetical protein D7X94_09410 [Acutalibacter sp. 1XD8-33]
MQSTKSRQALRPGGGARQQNGRETGKSFADFALRSLSFLQKLAVVWRATIASGDFPSPTEAAAETQSLQGLDLKHLRSAFFEGELAHSAKRKLFAREKSFLETGSTQCYIAFVRFAFAKRNRGPPTRVPYAKRPTGTFMLPSCVVFSGVKGKGKTMGLCPTPCEAFEKARPKLLRLLG